MLWIVIVGGFTMFATSCGIGANDVANSFATSVGAKTLTLRQAVMIASVFEFCGAFFLGSRVTDTIRKGMLDNDAFDSDVLMFGMLCASFSTAIWLALATWFKAPVSTTHSTVAAVVGFGMVIAIQEDNPDIIKWNKIYKIMISWIIAPILGGGLGFIIFNINKYGAFERKNPVKNAFRIFPVMLGLTIGANIFFIIYKGAPQLELDNTDLGLALGITFGVAGTTTIVSYYVLHYLLYDKLMNYLTKEDKRTNNILVIINSSTEESVVDDIDNSPTTKKIKETDLDEVIRSNENVIIEEETNIKNSKYGNTERFKNMKMYDNSIEKLYTSLQVFTACLSSFAHGSNDVANSIAPFSAIYAIYQDDGYQKKSEVPLWILAMGGIGIIVGLSCWGKKIMDRVGKELAGITPTRGFAMELSSSITVVMASRLEIPVSTTQVQTGSIIGTSLSDGKKNVDFKVLAKIFLGWVVTLPIAAGLSAALFSFGYYSPSNNEVI